MKLNSVSNAFLCYTACTTLQDVVSLMSKDVVMQRDIKKMFAYKEYCEDIIQDLYVLILNYNPDKLLQVTRENKLNYFVFSILHKQRSKKNNPLSKNYLNRTYELNPFQLIEDKSTYYEDNEYNQYLSDVITAEISDLRKHNWYRAQVWDEYVEFHAKCINDGIKFTYKKFGLSLNINPDSLAYHVRATQKLLIERLNQIK